MRSTACVLGICLRAGGLAGCPSNDMKTDKSKKVKENKKNPSCIGYSTVCAY